MSVDNSIYTAQKKIVMEFGCFSDSFQSIYSTDIFDRNNQKSGLHNNFY